MIGYEFDKKNVPRHKCSTLIPIKVSNTRINYVCFLCREIVAWTDDEVPKHKEDKIWPEASHFSESTINEYK